MPDSRYSGLNMTGIKTANRAMLLQYIFEHGGASRKTLAESLGLTPAAITQITRPMLEEGLLVEAGSQAKKDGLLMEGGGLSGKRSRKKREQDGDAEGGRKRAGRHQVKLTLNPEYGLVLCVNIGVEGTDISVCTLWGELCGTASIETDKKTAPEDFLNRIIGLGRKLMAGEESEMERAEAARAKAGIPLRAVSIGIVGEVDRAHGISRRAYGIWDEEVDLGTAFGKVFHVPVLVENNVRSFAMAELLFDNCRAYDSLLVVKWGPGVGSTIILKKEIYEGSLSAAGEIGHMIVEPKGRKCTCGRLGCLETVVGAAALKEHETDYLDYAYDTLARSIVNEMTILAPDHVILYGDFFGDKKMREGVLSHLASYDKSYVSRIVCTGLSAREAYIGPTAEAVSAFIRGDIES